MPSTRLSTLVFAPALALSLVNVAHAGPVERMADVALHPTDPDRIVTRFVNGGTGLFYSTDGGRSFGMICGAAIDPEKPSGPTAIAADGRVLIGVFGSLWQDSGNGCGWSTVEALDGKFVTDVVADPTDPTRMLVGTGNGGMGVTNSLWSRSADGMWTQLGMSEELGITRVRAVEVDGATRLYTSVLRVDPPMGDAGLDQPRYLLRVSNDMGGSWTETEVVAGEGSFRLEAVDPTNPDRILGSIQRSSGPDELLISTDGGKNFTKYLELTDLGGVAVAPDGRLWIAEPTALSSQTSSKGLWYAENFAAMPTKVVSDNGFECVAYQPLNETLYACQAYSFGTVDPKSWAFDELFHFRAATGFLPCEGKDMVEICEPQICADYCAPAHFAQSQLCCNYNTSSCGPLVAEMEGTGGPEMCDPSTPGGAPMTAAGTGAAGRPSASAGAGGTAAAGRGAAGTSTVVGGVGTAGSPSAPGTQASDGGGGCRALGEGAPGAGGAPFASLLLAAGLVLRVARKRRGR